MAVIFHADTGTVNIPSASNRTPEIRLVHEWLIWSIVNIFLGWGLGGIIPLICSILCRYYKRMNNLKRAETMSKFALITNIIGTTSGIIGWIVFIILSLNARRTYIHRFTN